MYRERYGKDPSGDAWESWKALSLGLAKLTRILVLPPGTPSERIETLRKGIKQMTQDPKFVSDWERIFGQKFGPVYVSPEEATMLNKEYMSQKPWQDWLRNFVFG